MTVRPLEAGELDEVRGLIEAYPYKTYRHYRVLSRKAQTEVMLAETDTPAVHFVENLLQLDSRQYASAIERIDVNLAELAAQLHDEATGQGDARGHHADTP